MLTEDRVTKGGAAGSWPHKERRHSPRRAVPRKTRQSWAKRTLVGIALALAPAAAIVLLYLLEDSTELNLLTNAEVRLTDLRFRLRGPRAPSGEVAVVAIDNQSVAELGRWPWPRSVHARLVDRLREWGASAVVFDVLFTEPQSARQAERLRRIQSALPAGAETAREEVAEALKELMSDELFAAAQKRAIEADAALTVLAFNFILPEDQDRTRSLGKVLDAAEEQTVLDLASFLSRDQNVPYLRRQSEYLALGIQPVITDLADWAAALGFVNSARDQDGVIRRGHLVLVYCPGVKEFWEEDRDLVGVLRDPRQRVQATMPLSIAGVQTHLRLAVDQIVLDLESSELRFPAGGGEERSVRFDAEDGTLLIDFYGPSGQIPTYSYADVLNGRLADGPGTLGGKLVFVGMTDPGTERDTFITPFTASLPGVEKHATVADNALSGRQLYRHRDADLVVLLSALGAALAAALAASHLSGAWALTVAGGTAAGWLVWTYRDFVDRGLLWNWTVPLLTLALAGGLVTVYRQIREQRARRRMELRSDHLQQMFGRYLSDEVVAMMIDSPEKLRLGGEKRVVTILLTDLRGFTALCERSGPDVVLRVLNHYLGAMADLVLKYNGTVDELIGDAVLALFGAPLARPDDARRAVACAIEMQRSLIGVNEFLREEGLPQLEMGIALNTGEVIVGNMGSVRRSKYGVIGSTVNVAARIESYTVGGQILISGATLEQAGDGVEIGDKVDIAGKGLSEPVPAYLLTGIGPPYNLEVPRIEEELLALRDPVDVRYVILRGKKVGGEELPGRFVRLSELGAEMACEEPLEPLVNLKLTVLDAGGQPLEGDLYSKVVKRDTEAGLAPLRFTWTPPAIKRSFEEIRAAAVLEQSRDHPHRHWAGTLEFTDPAAKGEAK